jgi:hypothetical protein
MNILKQVIRSKRYRIAFLIMSILGCMAGLILFTNVPSFQSNQSSQAIELLTNPQPTPEFISPLDPKPGYSGPYISSICFDVWTGLPLTTDVNSDTYIWDNTVFGVDNTKIDTLPVEHLDLLMLVTDANGQHVRGGPLHSCYDLSLGLGVHIANIQIKSMSGIVYSYSWAFRIETTDATQYAKALTATQVRERCGSANSCPTP